MVIDQRFAQRFTPRRKGSNWSAVNVRKVGELTEQGRMRPAGLAAFEARSAERTAVYSYEREEASFTEEETARFHADAAAWTVITWPRRAGPSSSVESVAPVIACPSANHW